MPLKNLCFAVALACSPVAATASTVPLTLDAPWTEFFFSKGNASDRWLSERDITAVVTYTVDVADHAYLMVTDAFRSGDRFAVSVNNVVRGMTSDASVIGNQIDADYDAAFADATYSSGWFKLSAGQHKISGTIFDQPEKHGRAALRVSSAAPDASAPLSPVPLPASAALLFAAAGALGATSLLRKRSSKEA